MDTKRVIALFKELNQIPRGSGNEKAVSDWLVAFAKERGLDVKQDEFYNVAIVKAATPGYEDRPSVILQGHMDMVCEKAPDKEHDFTKDPITCIEDGEWMHADQTTLGADNGIAVAMALAVLDSDTIAHGPLSCLFTTSEETGMDGAIGMKRGFVDGKYLLNIDTEDEGDFVVSCAGGVQIEVDVPLDRVPRNSAFTKALSLSLEGLRGGHSGMEIHKDRCNANLTMARVLHSLSKKIAFSLARFEGGTKHNAIPRNVEALIVCSEGDVAAAKDELVRLSAEIRQEYTPQDSNLSIAVQECPVPDEVYGPFTTQALLQFLLLAPNGVFRMSHNIEGLVETSNNVAIVKEEGDKIGILVSLRSLSTTPLTFLAEKFFCLATSLSIEAREEGAYPAWEYEPGSSLESQALAVYKTVTGKDGKVNAIHAGLECGLLKAALPNTEMISFGPDIRYAHTPQEKVNMASVGRIFTYLQELLKELR